MEVYRQLHIHYGDQNWWPAETAFEMMIGAILTQNTSWTNVETAIANLKQANMLNPESLTACKPEHLEPLIRPSGYFRQKAKRLINFAAFLVEQGDIDGLKRMDVGPLRKLLLTVNGIGPETADSMLLYALDRAVFVIDAYTKRIFSRLGLLPEQCSYDEAQNHFMRALTPSLLLWQEYHALIVNHAKEHCRAKPLCSGCPLSDLCDLGIVHVD
jgi:endonuclease-3 related protein